VTTQVAKWGNSLALRIPRAVAAAADVRDGDAVDVTVEDGAIVVRPTALRYSLDELVGRITARNRHSETDWGGPVGDESW
jgi:antitoxin MazE